MGSSARLPVIDFASFADASAPRWAKEATAAKLDGACREHGFIILKNSGMEAELVKEAFDAAKELFGLDESLKRTSLAKLTPETNRGYSPVGLESLNNARGFDMKESFNLRFGANDLRGTPDSFRKVAPKLLDAGREACRRYATACAVALGFEDDHFSKHFDKMDLVTIRLLHYPPCDEKLINLQDESHASIRLGEHTDFGFFTHVFVDQAAHAAGLQLKKDGHDSDWLSVDGSEGDCMVNTGALAARWTNDVWTATQHRVVVPDLEAARSHRYSIAFFFDPDAHTLVQAHPKFCNGLQPKYPPITSIDYLLQKLNAANPQPS